jgi:hypothetical protein
VWAAHAEVIERIEEKRRHLCWHVKRGYRGGWAYSLKLVENNGWFGGVCLSTGRIFPASLRSALNFVKNLKNPRAAFYSLTGELGGHLGKIGYFLHIKVEEYRQ